MTIDEANNIVTELKAVFDTAFDSFQKGQIERIYASVLGKRFKPTSCQNCYHDALIEVYKHLKRYGTMAQDCNYRLRAGFIINCPAFSQDIYTNENLTDEIAARYLEMFPANKIYFQRLPENAINAAESAKNKKSSSNSSKARKPRSRKKKQ